MVRYAKPIIEREETKKLVVYGLKHKNISFQELKKAANYDNDNAFRRFLQFNQLISKKDDGERPFYSKSVKGKKGYKSYNISINWIIIELWSKQLTKLIETKVEDIDSLMQDSILEDLLDRGKNIINCINIYLDTFERFNYEFLLSIPFDSLFVIIIQQAIINLHNNKTLSNSEKEALTYFETIISFLSK